jgi:1-acyl-sn-glycerol-3-phosphate acyltransferase
MRRLLFYSWFLLIVRPFVRLVLGVAVIGGRHLRIDAPAIIIANHNSHLDAAVLMDLMPLRKLHRVRPVAAADYFEQTRLRRIVFQSCMNVLPIRRDRVTREHNPLRAMVEAIGRGETLILFPEGRRGEPEKRSAFQNGIAHLILKCPDVPVVPVFMRNLGFSLPRGDFVPVPMFCDVFVGRPRTFTGTRDEIMEKIEATFARLRAAAERLHPSAPPEDDR